MSENKGKAKVKSKSKSIAKNAGKNKAAVMNSRNPKKPMAISGDTMSNYAMYKKGGKVKKYATGGMKKYQTAGQAYMQHVPGAVASDTLGVGDPANKFGMPSKKSMAQQKMLDLTYGKGRQQNSNEEDSGNAIYNRVSQAAGDVGNYVTDLKNRVTSGNWFNKKGGATKSKYKSGGIIDVGQPGGGSTKTAGSWRLEKKLAKEKQKKEIYNVQGYTDKKDKSDAQAKRAAEITGGNKTKNKNNTTISNDNVNSSSSSSRNTNANQNANQNSSSSSSSSNARGGSGGSSTVRATGGNDISTNVNRANQVSGGYQNQTEQNNRSKNDNSTDKTNVNTQIKRKGGLIKSKNKIMRTKTKKMKLGGNNSNIGGINSNNRRKSTSNTTTSVDNSDRSVQSDVYVGNKATQVAGGNNNKNKQQINSGNDNSRRTTNQSSRNTTNQSNSNRSTNVSNRSNRSTTNTNRSNVGNASSRTNQTVVRKKGGMVKSKKK